MDGVNREVIEMFSNEWHHKPKIIPKAIDKNEEFSKGGVPNLIKAQPLPRVSTIGNYGSPRQN